MPDCHWAVILWPGLRRVGRSFGRCCDRYPQLLTASGSGIWGRYAGARESHVSRRARPTLAGHRPNASLNPDANGEDINVPTPRDTTCNHMMSPSRAKKILSIKTSVLAPT